VGFLVFSAEIARHEIAAAAAAAKRAYVVLFQRICTTYEELEACELELKNKFAPLLVKSAVGTP
jgi:hypothetical protein